MKVVSRVLVSLFFITLSFFAASTQAAESTSVQINKTSTNTNVESSETRVSPVTNPELRAEAGSMSNYSLSFSLSYFGAAVNTPFADTYKKVKEHSASENKTALSGTLGARYRFNNRRTLDFGSGLKMLTPFNGQERMEFSSPYLSFNTVDKAGQLQYQTKVSASANTSQFYSDLGQIGTMGYTYGLKYGLGVSRYILSLEGSVKWFVYDRNVKTDLDISNLYVGLYPGLDYQISDKWSFKTSFSTSLMSLKRKNLTTWQGDVINQRIGVGVAVTPTVFVNPYLNFYPDRFTWETTTIAMNTVFSVF